MPGENHLTFFRSVIKRITRARDETYIRYKIERKKKKTVYARESRACTDCKPVAALLRAQCRGKRRRRGEKEVGPSFPLKIISPYLRCIYNTDNIVSVATASKVKSASLGRRSASSRAALNYFSSNYINIEQKDYVNVNSRNWRAADDKLFMPVSLSIRRAKRKKCRVCCTVAQQRGANLSIFLLSFASIFYLYPLFAIARYNLLDLSQLFARSDIRKI